MLETAHSSAFLPGSDTLSWRSEAELPPPSDIVAIDETCTADKAFRLACEGTALLWQGDFQNARQMLLAMDRRFKRRPFKAAADIKETFHRYRMRQAQRARTLGMLLIRLEDDFSIGLRRAPDINAACTEVYGKSDLPFLVSLREILGIIGAHQWRKKGVWIEPLQATIHPHYGVFSPVRGEYLQLVAQAPLPRAIDENSRAFDIGTGTGVLAAILAKRGVQHIIATDSDPRALACAQENISRLSMDKTIHLADTDIFPPGKASLIVCNPPWLPGKAATPLEKAIYDPHNRMLKSFLEGLKVHLAPQGEGWLILSNLAELLNLRSEDELSVLIRDCGLNIIGQHSASPVHPKAQDKSDPLYPARSQEITSLFRLAVQG